MTAATVATNDDPRACPNVTSIVMPRLWQSQSLLHGQVRRKVFVSQDSLLTEMLRTPNYITVALPLDSFRLLAFPCLALDHPAPPPFSLHTFNADG